MKNLSFCIVYRNRIDHLRQTLIPNIIGNNSDEIEFVLLDYNSNDGLEDWVKTDLTQYIDSGILVYYKNTVAPFFHRTHSRNMAIRLSCGNIICNLDADNFIGDGNGYADVLKAYGKENWDYPDPRCNQAPKFMYNMI